MTQITDELLRLFNLSTELVIFSGIDGYVKSINPAWTRTLGYSEQEILSTPLADYVHPDDVEDMQNGVALLYANTGVTRVLENRWRCKNGDYRWLSWNAVFVRDQGIYGVARDVTDAKATELALRESEERLAAVIDQMPAGIILAEAPEGRMILSNNEMDRILGRPIHKFKRVEDYSIPHLLNADGTPMAWDDYPLISAIVHGKTTHQKEVIIERPDGTQAICNVNSSPISNSLGETIAGVVVLEDITEQKLLQKQFYQSQKMEGIGRLAGGIAHDFNNLLSIIMGHAELINDDLPDDGPSKASILTILKAAQTAADLTRRMLVFGRRQAAETRIISPNDLLQSITAMLNPIIGDGVVLHTCLDSDIGYVRIDPNQLEQVVVNLVVNSCDAMPRGGELIINTSREVFAADIITLGLAIPRGTYTLLSVSDTGTGMDDEVRARLFEPFFTTKDLGKGTGLGLATAYAIIKQHGGYITVDTAPAQGTKFTIYLPTEENAATPTEQAPQKPGLAHSGETVLIVEDEPLLRDLSAKTLRKHSYVVLTAADGLTALEIATSYSEEIHLLLTDAIMPKMGGTELASQLRILRPNIRILLSSGYTEERLANSSDPFADAYFLPKPFTPNALLAKVREALSN